MATILDIQVVPTYNTYTISIQDISTYVGTPSSPTIRIVAPGIGYMITSLLRNQGSSCTS